MVVTYNTSPELSGIHNCAYNDDFTRMVVCNAKGRVQICDRSDQQQLWKATIELPTSTKPAVTQVAWAHSEHGSVVACGYDHGLVTIWQQAQSIRGRDERWIQRATLTESLKPITCLHFAPAQLGPQLAVASDDRCVRFYEASAALSADQWRLCNDLQATPRGGCKCLSWRPHTHGLPAMLCIGTTEGATVWFYRKALADWAQAAVLHTGDQTVTSIDWAPGRSMELIAAATSAGVHIWSLKGKAHELQVRQMECLSSDEDTPLDCLPIDGDAWKVQFDRMGTLLATSAVDGDSSSVCIWEMNTRGQWYLVSRVTGDPPETSAGAMPE